MASVELFGTWWGHEGKNGLWEAYEYSASGGVGVETIFYNASGKDIKYITFTYIPVNQVGDVITDVNGESALFKKFTGPIAKDTITCARFHDIWYGDLAILYVKAAEISIVFMDDTTEVISLKELVNVFNNLVVDNLMVSLGGKKSDKVNIEMMFSTHIFTKIIYEGVEACRSAYDYNKNSVFFKKYGEALNNLIEETVKRQENEKELAKIREEEANRKALAGKIGCWGGLAAFVVVIVVLALVMAKCTS